MAARIGRLISSCGSKLSFTPLVTSNSIGKNGQKLRSTIPSHSFCVNINCRRMASTGAEGSGAAVAAANAAESIEVPETGQQNPTDTSTLASTKQEAADSAPAERRQFVRKMKAAIMLSYSGQGYFGMQLQKNGTRTIENDLLTAFLAAKVVTEEEYRKPYSVKFQRAARTDKNVSAARQIVSMMVPKDFDCEAVNGHLPDQIRVMDYRKVTKGFDSKNACFARTYLYMIPTFAFTPFDQPVQEDYRMSSEVLENLRKILKLYVGTKNYHNFTSRKKPTDPSAKRFIMSFESSEPFLKDGLEYVVLKVKGQSFMLHQIRKMIGLAVAILRGYANEDTLGKAFTLDRIDIPMAPGLGLMLGEAHYDPYNKRYGSDGMHEALIWDNVADKIESFCQDKIYPVVTRTENEEKSMFNWLSTVPFHTYDVRDIDTPKGFGPLGKANLLVRKQQGIEEEDAEGEEDEDDDEEAVPSKRARQSE